MLQIGYIFLLIKRHIQLELYFGGALYTENMKLILFVLVGTRPSKRDSNIRIL